MHPCAAKQGAHCRLREAELMFQEDKVTDADRLMRTVVRKNPSYAGNTLCASPESVHLQV